MKVTLLLVVILCACTCAFARLESRREPRSVETTLDTCTAMTCKSLDQDCNYQDAMCVGDNIYCYSPTMKCRTYQAINQPCSNTEYCGANLVCGNSSVCVKGNKDKNEACVIDIECKSDLCENSKCVVRSIGQSCTSQQNCAGEFDYCHYDITGSTCAAGIDLNGQCDMTQHDNPCTGIYRCVSGTGADASTTGTCKVPYSKTNMQYCAAADECGDGLTCVNVTSTMNGMCVAVAASSGRLCDNSMVCDQYEVCACHGTRGVQTCQNIYTNNVAGISGNVNTFLQCMSKNCNPFTESCSLSKCKDQTCAVANSYYQAFRGGFQINTDPKCYLDSILPFEDCKSASNTASSSTALASAAAACVAGIALML